MSDKPWNPEVERIRKAMMERFSDKLSMEEIAEFAYSFAVECRAPAPQPAEGCGECHPMHNTICLCKCHDDGTNSELLPDLELLRRELRSKEDALITMEKAAADMLLHDGGEGSLNYDAHTYRESRRHLQSLAYISCDKCGETLPHLYDENCTDYRTLEGTSEQASPSTGISLDGGKTIHSKFKND